MRHTITIVVYIYVFEGEREREKERERERVHTQGRQANKPNIYSKIRNESKEIAFPLSLSFSGGAKTQQLCINCLNHFLHFDFLKIEAEKKANGQQSRQLTFPPFSKSEIVRNDNRK